MIKFTADGFKVFFIYIQNKHALLLGSIILTVTLNDLPTNIALSNLNNNKVI